MIPLLLIILFIIFLLYVLRKRHVEEYLIEGVNLSWRNKSGVEGIVEKWTLVVKDTQGNEIHRTENSDLNNRKNDTDVTLNVFTDKTFGDNIIGNNTIDIYYNDGSGDKLINTQILRFEKDEFNEDISSFEFRNLDMSAWENEQNKDCVGVYSKVKKDKSTPGTDKFGCGPSDDPNKHNCQFWEYKHIQKQLGTGKPCTRNEGHVIKVQWPKKANTDRVGLQFVDDPDPNTDSKVADTPQHYKSLFDQQQAVVDEQEKENAKIAKEAADKAAAEAFGGLIPNQTKLGDDGWCGHGGVVIHQVDGDVNTAKGCKRICSDINQVWTRDTSYGKWDSAEANRIVEECTDAKLDIIWEKDGDGKRKLRSGFTASKDYVPPSTSTGGIRYVWFGYENSSWSNRPLNISEIEVYSGGVNIVKDFGDDKVKSSSVYAFWTSPKKLFDGNKSNMAHTKDSKTNYFKIDLGKEYSVIDKVMVYNRHNCCYDRWAESFVKLLNTNGNEIMRSTDTLPSDRSKATNYKEGGVRVKTFTFGNTVVTSSSSEPMNSGGFKWYYYEGSYFSVPSSFNNKEPTAEGTGVTDFSSKHKATGEYLPNNGSKSNYAVRWQGRFVPKETGTHKFWTKSDDMSYLYVGNTKVIDNGGLHGEVEIDGTFNMTKGRKYLIEIFFSEKGGGDEMIVSFKEPNGTKTTNFGGYMVNDTKICSSEMFGGRSNKGVTDYKHCMECAHKWEPGLHKRSINCENLWFDD
tara:strand:- start:1295 stop:3517 length:2223 start_codon:yes stop_codon:yes gene_type:complete